MKITVWGRGPSSKALAQALGVKRNMKRALVYIRYKRLDAIPRQGQEVNTAAAIKRASHKYQSLVTIAAAGIKTVPISKDISDLTKDGFSGIIFGRDFYHCKGTDIITLRYSGGISDGLYQGPIRKDYYTKYIKPHAEYRYHVAFGKVILATKKVLADGAVDDSLIRNHQDGKWQQVTCAETPRFSEACIKAVQALGLDFGAVDFINYKKEPYILEVNTAPGLEVDNRLQAYANAFRENLR